VKSFFENDGWFVAITLSGLVFDFTVGIRGKIMTKITKDYI
jgi:hypothetical protein